MRSKYGSHGDVIKFDKKFVGSQPVKKKKQNLISTINTEDMTE